MPIYRVPVLTSSLPLQKLSSSNNQDGHHHQHQHPPHHYIEHHMQQQQQQLDPNENIIRRSQSIPMRMPVANHSSSPERVSIAPEDESIVEREIRLQLEREAEIASLHGELRNRRSTSNRNHGDSTTTTAPDETGVEMRREAAKGTPRGSTPDPDDGRKVIHQYSKVGESLIVKELLEQKRREEEVRNHTKNLATLRLDDTMSTTGDRRRYSAESESRGSRLGSGETTTQAPSSNIRTILRVQPFEDPEEEDFNSKQVFITPRMETVIEREIRVQRQREGSLRRARGYPLQAREDRLKEVEVRLGQPGEQRGLERRAVDGVDSSDGLSMQRLATNRLKQEILRERQREIDLRRQGSIYTISEERVGQLSSNNQLVLVEDSVDAAAGGGGARLSSSGRDDSQGGFMDQVYLQQSQSNDFYGDSDRSVAERAIVDSRRQLVLPSWRSAAELRIEEEVKEARRREKELREQRRLANATLVNQTEQQMQQMQQMQHQQNLSSQQHSKQFYRRT